jgi:broad specificity phosphatase PhoE
VLGDEAGSDSSLTELGRQQADRLGRWLAIHMVVDHVYVSPLKRAHETAHLIAAHLQSPVRVNGHLKEAWFFTGPELPSFSTPLDVLDGRGGGNEDYRRFKSQVAQALRDILGQHHDGTLLIIAHVGTIATMIRLLLGSDAFTVVVNNTTLQSLSWNGDRWNIEYIDRRDHLVDLRSEEETSHER